MDQITRMRPQPSTTWPECWRRKASLTRQQSYTKMPSISARGEVDEATHLYRGALSIGEKGMGLDHPEVAVTLNNLAVLLTTQGEYDEAKDILERAFATRKEILGDDHPEVAQSLNNIAEVHREKGAYDEAEPLHEQSLSVYEGSVGLVQPSVAAVYSN